MQPINYYIDYNLLVYKKNILNYYMAELCKTRAFGLEKTLDSLFYIFWISKLQLPYYGSNS